MAEHTGIEWTDATWNPVGGCSIASTGCQHCYAQRMAGTRLAKHPLYLGTTLATKTGPVFSGILTVAPDDAAVWSWPLRWRGSKTPLRGPGARSLIFVGDMSDLFHKDRPWSVIDKVFAVMATARRHDFQVLTKRPDVMADYCNDQETPRRVLKAAEQMAEKTRRRDRPSALDFQYIQWPLPNVWNGASVERQREADERVPHLLRCKSALRFLSCEPMLDEVRLCNVRMKPGTIPWCNSEHDHVDALHPFSFERVGWVICGGESGKDARPLHPDWARSLRDQCASAKVPFFFKQWGDWHPKSQGAVTAGASVWGTIERNGAFFPTTTPWNGHDDDGSDAGSVVVNVGKKAAGRMLDGRVWDEVPR